MVISKTLRLGLLDYYKKHLHIINHILPVQMTDREIEVLSCFMSLNRGDIDLFSTSVRRIVMDKLGLSAGGLSNYIRQLKGKGFIIEEGDKLVILGILVPDSGSQLYSFKLEVV